MERGDDSLLLVVCCLPHFVTFTCLRLMFTKWTIRSLLISCGSHALPLCVALAALAWGGESDRKVVFWFILVAVLFSCFMMLIVYVVWTALAWGNDEGGYSSGWYNESKVIPPIGKHAHGIRERGKDWQMPHYEQMTEASLGRRVGSKSTRIADTP